MMNGSRLITLVAAAGTALTGCGGSSSGGTAAAPPPQTPQRIVYQPFAAQYRAASHGRVEQEFSGQTMLSEFGLRYYVSAEAVDEDGVMGLTLTVDSVPLAVGGGLSAAEAVSAAGTRFTGVLRPEGHIRGFAGGDTTVPLVRQLASGLERIFPELPEGGVVPGQTWSDTIETTSPGAGLDILVSVVIDHRAEGWIQHALGRAVHIVSEARYTLSGEGMQGGSEISMEGSGVQRSNRYVSPDGRYLGGTSADTSYSTALVVAMGSSIPVTQIRFDTLAIVP
jgi:hypothetical protein